MSNYDDLEMDGKFKNTIDDSANYFNNGWCNYILRSCPLILFLNKQDLFEEKFKGNEQKFLEYFPEFQQYQLSSMKYPFSVPLII